MAAAALRGPGAPGPDEALETEIAAEALGLVLTRANTAVYPKVPAMQLRALHYIDRHEPINLTRLTEELGTIPSSASRLCDRLQAAGLLDRRAATTDRREVELVLTGDGRRLLDRLRAARRADLAEVLAGMTPQGRAALLHGLREFSAVANREPVGAERQDETA
ncbi:MarR family transcriptional regulator [Actinokineospora iranica]|uniref:DNA-binding transcriptional regulator, MarR family n=1 Tax=Actinokineospora iranica TaxID=1271860 RepID=A0A1G6KGD1_9PSEU|nr:MarR family transcriptional regulator [Actinokineospora iranica]SDC30080.1 DNA-binding transcriptional regulator, MarR family [Actinokineospora iranica]